MDEKPKYRIVVWDLDAYVREFLSMPASQQARLTDLYNNHLPHRPSQMRPPALKQLKGAQRHLYQFECGDKRLLYEIDEESMEVRIVALGKHLEWEKRGKVGG